MSDRDLFIAALEQPEAERQAWLDRACADDPDLRRRLDVLLRAHELASQFLASPAVEQLASPNGSTRDADPAKGDHDDTADVLALLAPPEKPGQLGKLAHYEVLEVVGKGAMGVVVKAFDPKLHRVVAVKLMARHLAASPPARRRFEREAKAVAAVRDEHVVAVHDVETGGPLPYLVMEFIGGVSLQERLDKRGPLEVKEILRIGMQAAQGLAAAHAQGLVHRDVKPANILLENGVERVKITDFGLARAVDDVNLTQSGVITGTPNYMSPEQADGRPVDHRSDLFSLGSVLYALATGHPPFRASGMAAVLKRVAADAPRPVREVNPDVPDWLEAIVAKLHAKDPAQRFQSAKEVAELLGQHLAHLQQPGQAPRPAKVIPPPATPVLRDIPWRPYLLFNLTLLALIAVIAMVGELWAKPRHPAIGMILSGILGPLFVIWFAFLTRTKTRRPADARGQAQAPPGRVPSRRDVAKAALLALISGTIAALAIAYGMAIPLERWTSAVPFGAAPWPRFPVWCIWLVALAFGLVVALVWYRWRRRSREGRRKLWQLAILLLPAVVFLILAFLGFPGFDWEIIEGRPSLGRSRPAPPQATRGNYLRVVKDDRDAEVLVTCNGERVIQSGAGGQSVNGRQLPADTLIDLSVRKGASEVHQERFRLRPGETREIHIPTIVLPERTIRLVPKAGGFPLDVTRMRIAPDRATVAVERLYGPILVFDANTGKERFTVARPRTDCTAFGFSPDGKELAYLTRAEDGESVLRVIDARDGRLQGKDLKPAEGPFSNARAVALSRDGKRLAICSAYNQADGRTFHSRIHRWEWPSGKELPPLAWHSGTIQDLQFTPGGDSMVAISDETHEVREWRWIGGAGRVIGLGGIRTLDALAVGPNETVAVAYWSAPDAAASAALWIRGVARPSVQRSPVRFGSLALSDDGKLVAAGNKSVANVTWEKRAAVRAWDAATGDERAVLLGLTDWTLDLAFTPDGKRLLSASKDGTLRWWDLP
jgi:serine/threonine protein kinase